MSDRPAAAPRPVSLVTIIVILAVLIAFLELVRCRVPEEPPARSAAKRSA